MRHELMLDVRHCDDRDVDVVERRSKHLTEMDVVGLEGVLTVQETDWLHHLLLQCKQRN